METVMEEIQIEKYPAYKDSEVNWLGGIPVHWEIVRSKRLFRQRVERAYTSDLQLTASQKHGIINQQEFMEKEGRRVTQVEFNRNILKHVEANDFVISMRSFQGGIEYSKYSGCISSAYVPLVPIKHVISDFFKYLFKSDSYIKALSSTSNLVRDGQALRFENFSQVDLTIIPDQEQIAIAKFLDCKTTLIDQAIGIKEKQIELLKERRQILIHKAVTRGLNPNVKMKDSGVEWIGEIPEHWEAKKLKYCLNGKLKYGANESGVEYDINLPRYIRITDFGQDGKLSEENKLSLTWKQGTEYLLKDKDILFARSGATVGKTYQFKKSMSIEENYCYAGYLIKADANEDIVLSDFLYLYTNSDLFNKWKEGIFIKATIENIGADKYSQLPIILPPLIEQEEILSKYKNDNGKFTEAITLKEKEIEKLKEYKSTLINSAVTGKIKVC